MTMHRLPDKKAAILSLQREDGGAMKIVQEGIKSKRFRIRAGLNDAFYGPEPTEHSLCTCELSLPHLK
jgi:hypothetical protein